MAVAGEHEPLSACRSWWIDGKAFAVEAHRAHSGKLLAKLGGIESREAALALKGREVAIPRAQLPAPEDGRYYWADLIGLEVVNAEGVELGVVQRLFSNGAHDVMELRGDGRTRLLPYVAAVVKQVDPDARRIEVDWGTDW